MLTLRYSIDGEEQSVRLEGAELTLGRGSDNDLVLPDVSVSRRHARLRREGERWRLEDLGSTNGVEVAGKRIDSALVRPGQRLQLGIFELLLTEGDDQRAPSPPVPMTGLPPFTLVTGNADKLRETARILGFRPEHSAIDLPEIQSLELGAVLRAKGEEAWRRLRRPLVVEEVGLELAAFGGFPGPLVKWMLKAIGAAGIGRAVTALGEPGAVARCGLLYRDADRQVLGEGVTRGRLLAAPRGEEGFGWDPVFVPDGSSRTYAELGVVEKDRIGHRGRAWADLLNKLENLDQRRA